MSRRRSRLAVAIVAVLSLCLASIAWAAWTSAAHGAGGSRTARVPAPAAPAVAPVLGGADLSWAAVTVGTTPATGYRVSRTHEESGNTVPATGTCGGVVTTLSCRDTTVEPGTWRFTVRALLGPWTGPPSPASAPVVVDGSVEATLAVSPRTASPGDPLTVSGSGWPAGGEVTIDVGSARLCVLTAADAGAIAGDCELPPRRAGSHAVRAESGVTVVDGGQLTVVPSLREVSGTVTPGGDIVVRGGGFAPTAVQATLGGQAVGSMSANGDGSVSGSLDVPASMPEGSHELALTDAQGNRATATVQVVTASLQVTPAVAGPGDKVQVTGAGWPVATSAVRLTINAASICAIQPDASGVISRECTVPDVLGGETAVHATNDVAVTQVQFRVVPRIAPLTTPATYAGASVTFTGGGFSGPGQAVQVAVDETPVQPTNQPQTATNGRVSATFTVPSLAVGEHTLRFTDATGTTATTRFTVAAPELSLSAMSGSQGDRLRVSGSGWPAGSHVTVVLGGATLCGSDTDAQGVFSQQCTLDDRVGGQHTVRATGGGASVTLATPFTVVPRLDPLSPSSTVAGAVRTVTGYGFSAPGQPVRATIDDTPVALSGTPTTSNAGRVTATFTVPQLSVGEHTLRLTDVTGSSATTPFTVTAPELAVSVTSGSPGDRVQISGSGWPVSTHVTVVLGSGTLCGLTTDAQGAFSQRCTLDDRVGGEHQLRASGGGASATLATPFTVVPRLDPFNPPSTVVGASRTVTGYGFSAPGQAVSATIDDLPVTLSGTPATSNAGRVSATFTVPDLPVGDHLLRIIDALGTTATATFTVVAPELSLSAMSGAQGDRILMSGQGWPAGVNVTVTIGGGTICGLTSSAQGSFSQQCTLDDRVGGQHTVRASGGGASVMLATPFTVVPRLDALSPTHSHAGASESVTGYGFSAPGQPVQVTIDGTPVATTSMPTPSNVGRVTATFTVPELSVGEHVLRFTDAAGTTATTTFTFLAPELELSRTTSTPGATVQVTGRGWPAGANVALHFGSANNCSFGADAQGGFVARACTVPDLPGGGYAVRGTTTGVSITLPGTFTILPELRVPNRQASPGQTITMSGVGLPASSDVQVTIAGSTVATVRTDSAGRTPSQVSVVLPDLPAGPAPASIVWTGGATPDVTLSVFRPTVVIEPAVILPGTGPVTIRGTGWPASATVTVRVGTQSICAPTTAADGTLSATCPVSSLPGGPDQAVTATAGLVRATSTVSVGIAVSLSPASLRAGNATTVTVQGLAAGRSVQLLVGGVEVATGQANSAGSWSAIYRVPAGTAPGQLELVVRQQGMQDGTAVLTVTA